MSNSRDYLPTASIAQLEQRATLIAQVRQFFEHLGFFHVETPILSNDIVVDRHLHPVVVEQSRVLQVEPSSSIGGAKDKDRWFYLQTSPEFAMKRLLVAGAKAIYQIGKVFRAGESGPRHNPEFTMLEWYRVGDGLEAGIDLLGAFASKILNRRPYEKISYCELFESRLGIHPLDCTVGQLAEKTQELGLELRGFGLVESARDEWLNVLMDQLEKGLGIDRPLIVYDWPLSQAALAKSRPADGVAERFELFVDGVELANGYHELLDPDELRERNRIVNQQRLDDGQAKLPEESRLLEAMQDGLPSCCGVAVGIDRLVMVAFGLNSIDQAIAFPIDRA